MEDAASALMGASLDDLLRALGIIADEASTEKSRQQRRNQDNSTRELWTQYRRHGVLKDDKIDQYFSSSSSYAYSDLPSQYRPLTPEESLVELATMERVLGDDYHSIMEGMVYIASDGAGNTLTVYLGRRNRSSHGQIFEWDHERQQLFRVESSLQEWLRLLIAGLSSEVYDKDANHGYDGDPDDPWFIRVFTSILKLPLAAVGVNL